MHNGLPALAAGISLAFGSTPASLSFAGASIAAGGVSLLAGPAGWAIGAAALGSYALFKVCDKKHKELLHLEMSEGGGSGGGDPNDPKDNEKLKENSTMYKDITSPESRYPNTETNITRNQFEKTLQKDGWNKSISKDGKVNFYEKNGSRYVVRDAAKSTGGPTADYYKLGSDNINAKIRLLKD